MNASPWAHSCMGGRCHLRDHCRHYHAGHEGLTPSERLCRPGEDGQSDVVSVQILRPVSFSVPSALEAA